MGLWQGNAEKKNVSSVNSVPYANRGIKQNDGWVSDVYKGFSQVVDSDIWFYPALLNHKRRNMFSPYKHKNISKLLIVYYLISRFDIS